MKPIKMGEFIGLTDKQLAKIQDNVRFNAYDGINSAIARQAKDWERINAELSESIEAGMQVDTYIGIEGEGFSQVAHADDLDQPGVIFSYSSHVKTLKANVAFLIDMFVGNMNGH